VGTAVINITNASLIASLANVSMMQTGVAGKWARSTSDAPMQANSIAPGSATGTSLVNFQRRHAEGKHANTTFITATTRRPMYGGGGTIDNNGIAITYRWVFRAGREAASTALSPSRAGRQRYVVRRRSYFQARRWVPRYATISGGAVTGIVITSPGTGYGSRPHHLNWRRGKWCGATAPTPTANTSGGMTFQGAGKPPCPRKHLQRQHGPLLAALCW